VRRVPRTRKERSARRIVISTLKNVALKDHVQISTRRSVINSVLETRIIRNVRLIVISLSRKHVIKVVIMLKKKNDHPYPTYIYMYMIVFIVTEAYQYNCFFVL